MSVYHLIFVILKELHNSRYFIRAGWQDIKDDTDFEGLWKISFAQVN